MCLWLKFHYFPSPWGSRWTLYRCLCAAQTFMLTQAVHSAVAPHVPGKTKTRRLLRFYIIHVMVILTVLFSNKWTFFDFWSCWRRLVHFTILGHTTILSPLPGNTNLFWHTPLLPPTTKKSFLEAITHLHKPWKLYSLSNYSPAISRSSAYHILTSVDSGHAPPRASEVKVQAPLIEISLAPPITTPSNKFKYSLKHFDHTL